MSIQDELKAKIPKKQIEVEALPMAFVVRQDKYDELLIGLNTSEREAIEAGIKTMQFKGVPVYRKDQIIELDASPGSEEALAVPQV
jgi:hypothetical protein